MTPRLPVALALLAATPAAAEEPTAPTASLMGAMLAVAEIDRELAFYREGLGMRIGMTLDHGSKREYMLRFGTDTGEAGIILIHDRAPPAPVTITHGNGFSRLVLRVTDLDATAARLTAAGFAHEPIRDAAQGYRMMMVSDPEGYTLELVQRAPRR